MPRPQREHKPEVSSLQKYAPSTKHTKPTIMAGDFNNVKDALDRLPVSEPDTSLRELDELKFALRLMATDGWRQTHPNRREYTFQRGTAEGGVCSRLDRIYVTKSCFESARDWEINVPGVKTDHNLVSVQLTSETAPTVG